MTFTRTHLRTLTGRLARTSGMEVGADTNVGSAGASAAAVKKLAEVYPASLVECLREVAGARLSWKIAGPAPQPLQGHLRIPDAAALLKFGFAYYAKQRASHAFPPQLQVAVVDGHNDHYMAWIVVEPGGNSAIHYAPPGEEASSTALTPTFEEYLWRGLDAWYLDYWHDPNAHLGNGIHVAEALRWLRQLPIERPVTVDIVEAGPINEAEARSWLKALLASAAGPRLKALKARQASIATLAADGLVRLRLRIDTPRALSLAYDRAAAVLADVPGDNPFLQACGASDPRFDWLWGRDGNELAGMVGVLHHVPLPEGSGPAVLDVEVVLARALLPAGATVGLRFGAVLPYS